MAIESPIVSHRDVRNALHGVGPPVKTGEHAVRGVGIAGKSGRNAGVDTRPSAWASGAAHRVTLLNQARSKV